MDTLQKELSSIEREAIRTGGAVELTPYGRNHITTRLFDLHQVLLCLEPGPATAADLAGWLRATERDHKQVHPTCKDEACPWLGTAKKHAEAADRIHDILLDAFKRGLIQLSRHKSSFKHPAPAITEEADEEKAGSSESDTEAMCEMLEARYQALRKHWGDAHLNQYCAFNDMLSEPVFFDSSQEAHQYARVHFRTGPFHVEHITNHEENAHKSKRKPRNCIVDS
jgi:hypothetical protein